MAKADIIAERDHIQDVVSQTVVETFNTMFAQHVLPTTQASRVVPDNTVLTCVKLIHGGTDVDFCFRFDIQLLLQTATLIFTPEYIRANPILDDLACEVANIVCNKVKAYLNDEGYHTGMGLPFIPEGEQAALLKQDKMVHIHFCYQGADGRQDAAGLAVNFTVT